MARLDHRVFVEWYDEARPGWGGYISSLAPDFGEELARLVEEWGPPTKVEFRAHGEGWVGPSPCEDCGESLVDCTCDY